MKADISKLNVGDKVHYQPKWMDKTAENGILKEFPSHTPNRVRVVYNCGDDWENYQNYTSILTRVEDLKYGWYNEKETEL